MTCITCILCLFTGLGLLSLSQSLSHTTSEVAPRRGLTRSSSAQDGPNLEIDPRSLHQGTLDQALYVEAKRQTLDVLPNRQSLDVRRKRTVAKLIVSSFVKQIFAFLFEKVLSQVFGKITLHDLLEEVDTLKEALDSLAPDIKEILARLKAQEFRDDFEKFAVPLQVQFDRFSRWEALVRTHGSHEFRNAGRNHMLHELDSALTVLHHRLLGINPYQGRSLPEKFLELIIHPNTKSQGFAPRETLRTEVRTFLEAVFDMQMIGFAIKKTLYVWRNETVSGWQGQEELNHLNDTLTVRLGQQKQHLQEVFRDCPPLHLEDEKWSPLTDLLDCTHGWQFGSVCTQVCDPRPGYRSLGYPPVQCLAHGRWSVNMPSGETRVACTHPCWSWDKTQDACIYDSPVKLGYFLDGETLCQDARCELQSKFDGIIAKPPFVEKYNYFYCYAHGDNSRHGTCVPTFNPLHYNENCTSNCVDIKYGTLREGVCTTNNGVYIGQGSCIPIQTKNSALPVPSRVTSVASTMWHFASMCIVLIITGGLHTVIVCEL